MEKLDALSKKLNDLGLEKESRSIYLIKLSFLKLSQDERIIEKSNILFEMIGLSPNYRTVRAFKKAASFLRSGPSTRNLFFAGILITGRLSGYQDMNNLLSKPSLEVTTRLAQKFLQNSGSIKSLFSRLKNPEVKKRISDIIPGGELFSKYSDRMFSTIEKWAEEILDRVISNGLSLEKLRP